MWSGASEHIPTQIALPKERDSFNCKSKQAKISMFNKKLGILACYFFVNQKPHLLMVLFTVMDG
jgi:hypothetical protein